MKKLFLVLMVCFGLILSGSNVAIAWNMIDDTPGSFKEITNGQKKVDLSDYIVSIVTLGTGTGIYFDFFERTVEIKEGTFAMHGSGFVIAPNYIVTAAHVIDPSRVQIENTETEIIKVRRKIIYIRSSWSSFMGASVGYVEYIDKRHDVALLFCPDERFKVLPYELYPTQYPDEYSCKLYDIFEEGDALTVWVRERDEEGIMISSDWKRLEGVMTRGPQPSVPEGRENALPVLSENHFATTVPFFPGCSGSPIFAFIKGKPIIVGIAVCIVGIDRFGRTMSDAYFYGTRIDRIARIMAAYKGEILDYY